MQRLAPSFALCALSAGCDSFETVYVPAGGASLIIVAPTNAPARLYAVEEGMRRVQNVPLEPPPDLDLFLLSYDCTLGALSIPPGWHNLVTSPREGRPLPWASRMATSRIGGRAPTPWRDIDALPSEIASLRLDQPKPCVEFETTSIQLGDTPRHDPLFAVPIAGDDVLAVVEPVSDRPFASSGKFFRVSPSGSSRLTDLPMTTPHELGFRASDGDLWLISGPGDVVAGDIDRGFEPRPKLPTPAWGATMTGSKWGSPVELFVLTHLLTLEHLGPSGKAWERVGMLDGERGLVSDITWIAPGHAAAATNSIPRILRYRDGNAIIEAYEPEATETPWSIDHVPGSGLLIGGECGTIFRERPAGEFERLDESPLGNRVAVFAPLGDGILVGTESGVFTQYQPGYGFCDSEPLSARRTKALVAVASGFFLFPRFDSDDEDLRMTFLRPTSAPPPVHCPATRE